MTGEAEKRQSGRPLLTVNAWADELGLDRRFLGQLIEGIPPDGKTSRGWDGYYLGSIWARAQPHYFERSRHVRRCPTCGR